MKNNIKGLHFTEDLVKRYWQEKFHYDLSNYFIVNDWKPLQYDIRHIVSVWSTVEHLNQRSDEGIFDGSPAVYMGCGPWWNTEQNFVFSGIFAFLHIVERSISKICGKNDYFEGNEESYRFCKEFTLPLFLEVQSNEFDIVWVLKEAYLAPEKAEIPYYLSMLDKVVPYMIEVTNDYIYNLGETYSSSIRIEIEDLLNYLRHWACTILSD